MKHQIRNVLLAAIFSFFIVDIVMASDDYEKLKPFVDKIEAGIPKNWRVVEKKQGEIPEWHYENMEYSGPKGIYLYIVGDHDVDYEWKDREGVWHKKPFYKEAIRLWIMPSDYKQSWKRFFVFKGHVTPPGIYLGKQIKIYAKEDVYRDPSLPWRGLKKEFPNAFTYAGAPEHTVRSWITWKEDIKKLLEDMDNTDLGL
ncbi:MAG: hypothetical protein LBS40_08895 [Burkholderiales bacterium]|jgi:hypothetical protein|nr:hypothetical protein [Burkholderiales bacterium]